VSGVQFSFLLRFPAKMCASAADLLVVPTFFPKDIECFIGSFRFNFCYRYHFGLSPEDIVMLSHSSREIRQNHASFASKGFMIYGLEEKKVYLQS
jgi:hypothetical protein